MKPHDMRSGSLTPDVLLGLHASPLRTQIIGALETREYRIVTRASGADVADLAARDLPRIVILDWDLEGVSGVELCLRFRRRYGISDLPIILLVPNHDFGDRLMEIAGHPTEVFCHSDPLNDLINAICGLVPARREPEQTSTILAVNDVVLDLATHRCTYRGSDISLSPAEFYLLGLLMRQAGQPVRREEIIAEVSQHARLREGSLSVVIGTLRRKLAAHSQVDFIRTVHRGGFSFSVEKSGRSKKRWGRQRRGVRAA